MSRKLLFVVNDIRFFISHRLPIAVAAMRDGWDVHVAAAPCTAEIQSLAPGLTYHAIPLSRSGYSPQSEIRTFLAIFKLFRQIRPDIVHLITAKPVVYGGIAARLNKVPSVVVAIAGLGYLFDLRGKLAGFRRKALGAVYKIIFRHPNLKVIFQNSNDLHELKLLSNLSDEKIALIRGSGVNLQEFIAVPEKKTIPIVSFAARLLKTKGVVEFVDAARLLNLKGINAQYWLIGVPDRGNPDTLTEAELQNIKDEGLITIMGQRSNIAELFADSHIVVLPSYYGEGLPKVLIEAAACGRAVITTDHPGCRDAIKPGVTGLLVPIKNAQALADAIENLVLNPDLRQRLGMAGRRFAETYYSIENIVGLHLDIYRQLASNSPINR